MLRAFSRLSQPDTADDKDNAHTAKHFSAGEGDRKGDVSTVWAIFSDNSKSQTFRG